MLLPSTAFNDDGDLRRCMYCARACSRWLFKRQKSEEVVFNDRFEQLVFSPHNQAWAVDGSTTQIWDIRVLFLRHLETISGGLLKAHTMGLLSRSQWGYRGYVRTHRSTNRAVWPGFPSRDSRENERTIHSPRDLERDNRNLAGGAIDGGAAEVGQLFLRPTRRTYSTPARGLYLCSASTPPPAEASTGCVDITRLGGT